MAILPPLLGICKDCGQSVTLLSGSGPTITYVCKRIRYTLTRWIRKR